MGRKQRRGLMHDWRGNPEYDYEGYVPRDFKVKKGWDTGDAPKVCTNCDWHTSEQKQVIHIDHEVWKALMGICTHVKLEWQALLTGVITEAGVVHVTGYFIPKQEVSSASVKNLDMIDDVVISEKKIVAGVHSHGSMACFFSATDMEDTNMSLIRHNIVVNNRREYKAQSRIELPCGMVKFIEGEVFTIGEPVKDIVGLDNIKECTYGFQTPLTPKFKNLPSYERGIDEIVGALRWCPTCGMCPEEDGGMTCTCWTKSHRTALPDFTEEFYVHESGRTWELKPEYEHKYKNFKTQE